MSRWVAPRSISQKNVMKGEKTMMKSLSILMGVFVVTLAFFIQAAVAQEDVGRLIKQLEDDSDRFSNTTTKALDSSKWDGTDAEDEMIKYVRNFEDAIDRLKKTYEDGKDTLEDAKEVQTRAKTIDKFLKKNPLGTEVDTDWGTVRADLLRLAKTGKVKTT
jgi:ElaB/YqjD/DUF883 family membrane-anchored ribosome-binding protein